MMAASRMPSATGAKPDDSEIRFFSASGQTVRAQSLPALRTSTDEMADGQQSPRSFLRRPRSPVSSLSASISRGLGAGGDAGSPSSRDFPSLEKERNFRSVPRSFSNKPRSPVSSLSGGEKGPSITPLALGLLDSNRLTVQYAGSQNPQNAPPDSMAEPNASSSEDPEIPSDVHPVSTFVIFTPGGTLLNDPTAIRPNDVSLLENFVPNGGNSCDVHRSTDAEAWVERHYDEPLLKSIRSAGLGGPIATILSPETPALAIFGSILDNRVLDLAQALCEASSFVVMVRPLVDDPVALFVRQSLVAEKKIGAGTRAPLDAEDEEDDEADGESFASEENTSDDDSEDVPTRDGVFRLRGGASRRERDLQTEDDPDYILPAGIRRPEYGLHRIAASLHLHVKEDTIYDIAISAKTAFKFQTLQPESPQDLADPLSRPQVMSNVDLKVEMRPAEVRVDRSYSNLGFIVQKPNHIADREYLPRGFERPSFKSTRTTQKSAHTDRSFTVGLDGGKPTLSGTTSFGRATGETEQLADEKPVPLCYVKEQIGKQWNSQTQSYTSYDLVWHSTVEGDGSPHPLQIQFGMGIEFYGKEERYLSKLPRISHILRNQIVLWVHDPSAKAKVRGMIVLTTTYLPDIRTTDPIHILEDKNVDLDVAQPHDPQPLETTRSPHGHDVANSLAIGLIDHTKPSSSGTSGKTAAVRKFMHDIVLKSFRQNSKKNNNKPVLVDLPLHEYVARGWDETNKQWRNTVWPTLDAEFRDVSGGSEKAVWGVSVRPGPGSEQGAVGTAQVHSPPGSVSVVPSRAAAHAHAHVKPVAENSGTDSGSTSTTFGSYGGGGILVGLPSDSGSDGSPNLPKLKPSGILEVEFN